MCTVPTMTTATDEVPATNPALHVCKVTGEPYVRTIQIPDYTQPDGVPIHVTEGILFDGERMTRHATFGNPQPGINLVAGVEVHASSADGTQVTLWVDVDYCTPPFVDSDGGLAPATIGGRPFLSPAHETWDLETVPSDPIKGTLGEYVRCTVFVGSIIFG